jgi:hypothetical protein
MEQRNSLVVILLAALLGSAVIVPRASGPSYEAPTAAPTQSSRRLEKSGAESGLLTPRLRAHDARGILNEFFSGTANDSLDKPPSGEPILHEASPADYQGWTVESLIATVPDPVESGLGSLFDDFVDSIEHAATADGYNLDQFFNPWPSPDQLTNTQKDDQSDGRADSSGESGIEKRLIPIYEKVPGLMLFRKTDEEPKRLLVLFVVGETPTTGIHKGAFEDALAQASKLISDQEATCRSGRNCQSSIKVVGPSFSGSATSMKLAIAEWSNRRPRGSSTPKVEIISGSATSIEPETFASLDVTYHATIIPDKFTMPALLLWLNKEHGQGVAILSEENTSYGTQLTKAEPGLDPENPWKMLYLRYPLHIAELQRAAERKVQTAKTGAATTPSLSNPNLPLDTHESHTRRDVLPLYSTAETNRVELVLDANMREINEHKISYVIVTATDPADMLFLLHWVRQNCPKVTPIALTADLLYLHTDVNAETRGMIVATTYPLYIENQLWTLGPDDLRSPIQFSLDTSEGIYNATLTLLNPRAPLLDYAWPFAPDFKGPPLWISFVGVDQLWPVSIQDARVSSGYMVENRVENPSVQTAAAATDDELKLYSKPFQLTCLLIALWCFLVWSLIAANDTENLRQGFAPILWLSSKTPASLQQILGSAVLPECRLARRQQLILFSATIFSLLATVAWYFFLPIGTPVQNLVAWQIRLVAPLVTVVAVAAGAASIAPPSRFADPPWRIYSRLGLSGFLAFACLIALVVAPGDPVKRLFLFLRTADLGSKVSPLVPMLLTYAAAIALSLGALRRQALIESRQVLTPLLDFGTESFSGVADLERRVRELVGTGAWPWRTYISVGVPIALTYGFALPFRQFSHSHVDTVTFKGLFCIVSLAVYTGICLAIVKMVSVWLSVRKLLRRIYTHPSRGGYAAYRQQLHFIKQPAIDLLSKVPAMSQLEVALEQVRQLLITSDDPGTRASAEIEKRLDQERPWLGLLLPWAEQSINETEEAEATGDWSESILKKRRTEIWMAFLSRSIAYIFEPLWRTINPSRLPQTGTASKESNPIDTIGEIYVASRVVDFLRQVMPQLETLALTTTLAMLLMLFAVSSYPFPARDSLLWFSWFVVLAAVGSMMWMFFSLNRDRVASMIAGTTPGQTDWNSTLVLQVATHALIPVLVLLGAAFPSKLGTFVTWIGSLFGGHA